jgi:hypothetical protein
MPPASIFAASAPERNRAVTAASPSRDGSQRPIAVRLSASPHGIASPTVRILVAVLALG